MITIAKTLADSVIQAIEDAPLGQRVAALTQLTDRIMKLAAQLPGESEESEIRIVIVDEEGNAHTPIPDPDEDYR
jgi:hypothetical protein